MPHGRVVEPETPQGPSGPRCGPVEIGGGREALAKPEKLCHCPGKVSPTENKDISVSWAPFVMFVQVRGHHGRILYVLVCWWSFWPKSVLL